MNSINIVSGFENMIQQFTAFSLVFVKENSKKVQNWQITIGHFKSYPTIGLLNCKRYPIFRYHLQAKAMKE